MTCIFVIAFLVGLGLEPATALGPITLTLGTTAVVLTGCQCYKKNFVRNLQIFVIS
jgi:hypothetical protein